MYHFPEGGQLHIHQEMRLEIHRKLLFLEKNKILPANSTNFPRIYATIFIKTVSREPKSCSIACLTVKLVVKGPGVNNFESFSRLKSFFILKYQ